MLNVRPHRWDPVPLHQSPLALLEVSFANIFSPLTNLILAEIRQPHPFAHLRFPRGGRRGADAAPPGDSGHEAAGDNAGRGEHEERDKERKVNG